MVGPFRVDSNFCRTKLFYHLLLVSLVLMSNCSPSPKVKGEEMKKNDYIDAIELATLFLKEQNTDFQNYKLVSAENDLLKITDHGPVIWRVTFKLRRLIPQTPGLELGSGGEIFIEVDIRMRSARIAGYGE